MRTSYIVVALALALTEGAHGGVKKDAQEVFGDAVRNERGQGVPRNQAEALRLYRIAAEMGHVAAQNNLGNMYREGRGVAKSESEAIRWYSKAAEHGSGRAQYNLAVMYEYGLGVTRDSARSKEWYRRAAANGVTEAVARLRAGSGTSQPDAGGRADRSSSSTSSASSLQPDPPGNSTENPPPTSSVPAESVTSPTLVQVEHREGAPSATFRLPGIPVTWSGGLGAQLPGADLRIKEITKQPAGALLATSDGKRYVARPGRPLLQISNAPSDESTKSEARQESVTPAGQEQVVETELNEEQTRILDAALKLGTDGDDATGEIERAVRPLGPGAVPHLIEALDSKSSLIRMNAAFALGCLGKGARSAVSALVSRFQDQDERDEIVAHAVNALGRIGPEEPWAISAVIELLRDKRGPIRQRAAFALDVMGPAASEAVPALTDALQDPEAPVRDAAAGALRSIDKNGAGKSAPIIEVIRDADGRQRLLNDYALEYEEGKRWAIAKKLGVDPMATWGRVFHGGLAKFNGSTIVWEGDIINLDGDQAFVMSSSEWGAYVEGVPPDIVNKIGNNIRMAKDEIRNDPLRGIPGDKPANREPQMRHVYVLGKLRGTKRVRSREGDFIQLPCVIYETASQ